MYTLRFWRYVWPFFINRHERIKGTFCNKKSVIRGSESYREILTQKINLADPKDSSYCKFNCKFKSRWIQKPNKVNKLDK